MGILSVANAATQEEMCVHPRMDEEIGASRPFAGAIGRHGKRVAAAMPVA
jgi:hypothetical protein